MRNVKFRCVLALYAADAKKKSNHFKLYSIHNGSIMVPLEQEICENM